MHREDTFAAFLAKFFVLFESDGVFVLVKGFIRILVSLAFHFVALYAGLTLF